MKVLFFARLRELHGSEYLEIDDGDCPANVGALRELIRERADPPLAEALADPNVFCAVDQRVADDDVAIAADQEIAFFPPMTGG